VCISYLIDQLVAINENFQSIETKSHGTEGFPIQQAFYKDPDIYQPEFYLVQFYKIEPEIKVGTTTVQCTKMAESLTQLEVSYEYVGLSEKGNEFIEGFTSTEYDEFISEWNNLLVSYFESKC